MAPRKGTKGGRARAGASVDLRSLPTAAPAKRAELGFGGGDGIGLEAGRMGRRLRGWIPTRVHVNTLISQSGLTTLARSRFLFRNNPYAKSAAHCFTSNTIGTGIRLSWNSPIAEADAAAAQKADTHGLFDKFALQADADGVGSIYDLQTRGGNELFIAGEYFVRKRPRLISDGLAVPLQLQLLPSEMLPTFLTMPLDNGNVIRQGIEFDRIGRRTAYHFWRSHPGDMTVIPKWGERVRIPADQILHVYIPEEIGQIRGLPRLTPSIVSMWMLDLYDDAELDRKKTAALFSLFIRRPDPDGEFFNAEKTTTRDDDNDGDARVKLEPGAAHVLFPGEDISVAAPADSGHSYDPFQYRTLTRICAGAGLPYAGVTWDLMRANYSNMRGALMEARRRIEVIQKNIIGFQFCTPVIRWFLDAAHISGGLAFADYAEDPAPYLNADWIAPRWMWIDPEKDMYGEVLAIDAGIKARSHTIEETGRDPIDVDNRIAADRAREKRLGLVFVGTKSVRGQISEAPEQPAPDGPADGASQEETPAPAAPSNAPPSRKKPSSRQR